MRRRKFIKSSAVLIGGFLLLIVVPAEAKGARVRFFGVKNESFFLADCNRCGRCLDACSSQGLGAVSLSADPLQSGTPELRGYCIVFNELLGPTPDKNEAWLATGATGTPCLKCISACPTGALQPVSILKAQMGYAVLNQSTCLAWVSGTCNKCYMICPVGAVTETEPYRPVVDLQKCIGCSQCVAFCPTSPKSIIVKPMGVS